MLDDIFDIVGGLFEGAGDAAGDIIDNVDAGDLLEGADDFIGGGSENQQQRRPEDQIPE